MAATPKRPRGRPRAGAPSFTMSAHLEKRLPKGTRHVDSGGKRMSYDLVALAVHDYLDTRPTRQPTVALVLRRAHARYPGRQFLYRRLRDEPDPTRFRIWRVE